MSRKRVTTVRQGMKLLSRESGTGNACVAFDVQSNMASQSRRPALSVPLRKRGMKSDPFM